MSRCTGHCCKGFYLPEHMVLRLMEEPHTIRDGQQVRDMIIVTEEENTYNCLNLLPSGNCGAYETRPAMCRKYPDGEVCKFDGCTLDVEPSV